MDDNRPEKPDYDQTAWRHNFAKDSHANKSDFFQGKDFTFISGD